MPTSGSGIGTPVVIGTPPEGVFDQYESYNLVQGVVPLHRYAQLMGHDECAFWGINYEGQAGVDCNSHWSEYFRQILNWALREAQQEIENFVRFPLQRTWITGKVEDQFDTDWRFVDQQYYRNRSIRARWNRVIEAGVRTESTVSSGIAVSHITDPAVIGPISVAFTNTNEVKVYYTGTSREIYPSSVTISGGNLTVRIPRCRLLKASLFNVATTPDYEDTDNFVPTVDIKRVYNDPSTNAEIITPHTCSTSCAVSGCSEYSRNGCIYIRDEKRGVFDVLPAAYSNGAWGVSTDLCCNGSIVRLNYCAGLQVPNNSVEMAVIRLAHVKLPNVPCLCGLAKFMWEQDREVPKIITRVRMHCPFGLENGAWSAYLIAKQLHEERRVGVL